MDNPSANNSMVGTEEVIEGSHGGPYMVEKIVGIYMGKDGKKYFRVKWLDSWEPAENLSEGCQQLINDFMSGASAGGKTISNVNLQLGQVIIKTEEMLSPTTQSHIQVSSSTSDSSTNVSSSTHVTSSSKKRNPSSNQKKKNNSNQNEPTLEIQNRNAGKIIQNKVSPQKTKRTTQTVPPKAAKTNQQVDNLNRKSQSRKKTNQDKKSPTNQKKKSKDIPVATPIPPQNRLPAMSLPNRNISNIHSTQTAVSSDGNKVSTRLNQSEVPSQQLPTHPRRTQRNTARRVAESSMQENINSDTVNSTSQNMSFSEEIKLIDQKTKLLQSLHATLQTSPSRTTPDQTFKTSEELQSQLSLHDVNNTMCSLRANADPKLSSPQKKLSSPIKNCPLPQKIQTPTTVQTKPSAPVNSQLDNEQDEVEKEIKSLINKTPVKKSNSSEEEEEEIDPTAFTSLSHPRPSEQREVIPELMSSNSGPIKKASPTSVIPVEATSTMENEVDSDEGMKMSGEITSAKKQLDFDSSEFIPKTADEPSPPTITQTLSHNIHSDSNSPLLISDQSVQSTSFGYKDKHNVIHSSPPHSYYSESEYNPEHGQQVGGSTDKNIINAGVEKYVDGSNYILDDEEEADFVNYKENLNLGTQQMDSSVNHQNSAQYIIDESNLSYTINEGTQQMDYNANRQNNAQYMNDESNSSYTMNEGTQQMDYNANRHNNAQYINDESNSSYPMDMEENNLINLDDDNIISDNEQETYDAGAWNEESHQYEETTSMMNTKGNQFENPSEDVIALDSDDDNEIEIIVSIDSPQSRRRGRLPVAQSGKRGRPPGSGVRGAHTPSGGHLLSVNNIDQNEFLSNEQPPPLVHPRLMLSSPHTSVDESRPQPMRTVRGRGRGGSVRGKSRQNNTVVNSNTSPMQQNLQNGPISPANSDIVTTPSRKRPRVENQNNPHLINTLTTPTSTQNRNRVRTPQTTPTSTTSISDSSPSRSILNDRTCMICNQAFSNLTLARQHAKQAHPSKQVSSPSTSQLFSCQVCNAMFKTNKDLLLHMTLHDNNRNNNTTSPANLHKCDVCFRGFKQRSVLMQHLMVHADELPYACVICEKRFKQQSHLILHLGTHGRNNEGTYKCPHCSIEFNDDQLFAEHMQEHDAELPFKCNFCQQRFELKSNLMLHLQGHNDGRPYTCHICKKSFKKKTYYFGHMQMHKIKEQQQHEENPGVSGTGQGSSKLANEID